MLILALDTSTFTGSVALAEWEPEKGPASMRVLAEITAVTEKHAETLIGRIAWCLDQAGRDKKDLGALAYARGPGSFTGLRVGLAALKGIAIASRRPLVAVPTLTALSMRVHGYPGPVAVVMDARRGEVFLGCYDVSMIDTEPAPIFQEQAITPDDAVLRLKSIPIRDRKGLMLGDGIARFPALFKPMAKQGSWLTAPPHLSTPRASDVAFLACFRLGRAETFDPASAPLVYLRDSGAKPMRADPSAIDIIKPRE